MQTEPSRRLSRLRGPWWCLAAVAAAASAGCQDAEPAAVSRADCQLVLERVVDLRLAEVGDSIPEEDLAQHRAIRIELGSPLVESCVAANDPTIVDCVLSAPTSDALAGCRLDTLPAPKGGTP